MRWERTVRQVTVAKRTVRMAYCGSHSDTRRSFSESLGNHSLAGSAIETPCVSKLELKCSFHSEEGYCMSQPLSPSEEEVDIIGATAGGATTPAVTLEQSQAQVDRLEMEMKLMEARLKEKGKSEEASLIEVLKKKVEEMEERSKGKKRKVPDGVAPPDLKSMLAEVMETCKRQRQDRRRAPVSRQAETWNR